MQRRQFLNANAAVLAAAALPGLALAATGPSSDVSRSAVDNPLAYDHKFADVNGIRMHYVEAGKGPLVILLHGFPLLWYSWRNQIAPLAAAGYRVVVPDQRGYGQTSRPSALEAYDLTQLVGDIVGLIGALGEKSAVLVGWDWGSGVAQYTALMRPDLVRAVAMVTGPVMPRSPATPSAMWKAGFKDKVFYQQYFQQPGKAEREMALDVRKTMASALYSLSASAPSKDKWRAVMLPTETMADTLTEPKQLPPWLSTTALDYYTAEYTRSGFTGPLNWYRNLDRDWEMTSFLAGARIQCPLTYIGGAEDEGNRWARGAYDAMEHTVPKLMGKTMVPNAGHMIPEEKPVQFNALLLDFLGKL
ncbi:MAG: alpha/beta hydrolase [Pseudomonadota bacterium]